MTVHIFVVLPPNAKKTAEVNCFSAKIGTGIAAALGRFVEIRVRESPFLRNEKIKRLGISPKRIAFFRGQFGCSFEDAVEFALERKYIIAWNRKKDVKIIFKNWTLGAEQCGISADSARSAYLGGIPCNDWFFDDSMDFDSDEVFKRLDSENKRLKQRVKLAKDILKKTFWYLSQIDLITIKKVTDFISED